MRISSSYLMYYAREAFVVSLFWLKMAYGFLCSSFGLTVFFILPRQCSTVCCVLMLMFVMISMFLSKIIPFKHCCVALLTINLSKSSWGYFLRYDRKQMQHCIKWFFKLKTMDDGECAQRLENTGPHRGEGFQMFCLPSKNNTLFDWYKPKTSICLFPIEARTRTVQPVYKLMYG